MEISREDSLREELKACRYLLSHSEACQSYPSVHKGGVYHWFVSWVQDGKFRNSELCDTKEDAIDDAIKKVKG